MSIWTRLYEHSNYRGRSTFANLHYTTPVTTYLRISKSWLSSAHIHDRISSLEIGGSHWEQGGRVVLFQHSNYRGRYANFGATPGSTVRIPNVSAENFNDITSSVLIVRRYRRELGPLALGSMGSPDLRTQIQNQVSGISRISMRGTPIITWDLWPGFSPSRKYVYLRVPIRVDVPNWFDYDAELRFWIYLYVDSGQKVRGYVNWYGAWVEGGMLTGKILDRLMNEIPGQLGNINSSITSALSMLSVFNFVGLYYLPGTAGHTGNVNDDVSVVFVKEW